MSPDKAKNPIPGVADGKVLIPLPTSDDDAPEVRVKALITNSMSDGIYPGWAGDMFKDELRLISASAQPTGKTIFEFTVLPVHCNRLGNLHGGCTATIFDFCTTTALAPIARPGYWAYSGVSRTLNVTYLRPVPEGATIRIESEVVHAGKRLCTLKGTMRTMGGQNDGQVLAICEHGKVTIDPVIEEKL